MESELVECNICLEEKKNYDFKWLPCSHSMCIACFDKYTSNLCPFCRHEFDTDTAPTINRSLTWDAASMPAFASASTVASVVAGALLEDIDRDYYELDFRFLPTIRQQIRSSSPHVNSIFSRNVYNISQLPDIYVNTRSLLIENNPERLFRGLLYEVDPNGGSGALSSSDILDGDRRTDQNSHNV